MAARALIVEDDDSVRDATAQLLGHGGMNVVLAHTGEHALCVLATDADFDLVVLDASLPGINGFDVCRRLRERSVVPIVMLSARADVGDVVVALEMGADDYVITPFDDAELLARVRSALRRVRGDAHDPRLRFGDLVLDPITFRVEVRGQPVDCTATELRLLFQFVRNPQRALTRDELLDRVWGCEYLGDSRLVDMAIKRLRRKLGDVAHDPCYIATVRGEGYRFCASSI
jgi:two-component system response regulator MtrA